MLETRLPGGAGFRTWSGQPGDYRGSLNSENQGASVARENVLALPGSLPDGGLNAPLAKFLLTYALTVGGLLAFGYVWGEAGFGMLVVAMGWPHVLLGFLFYSRRITRRGSPHRFPFFLLLVLTLAISFIHSLVAITTAIYLYFVFHAFRDEILIFRQRRTGFRFRGTVLDRNGAVFLIALLGVSGFDQLAQFAWRPVYREVTVPVAEVAGRDTIEIEFQPLDDSAGREYYLSVVVPESDVPVALWTYMTRTDMDATGEILVGEKSLEDALYAGSRHDLYFESSYGGTQPSGGLRVDDAVHIQYPLSGGHVVGQTFRAPSDGLRGIRLPLLWMESLPGDLALEFTLRPAASARFPFAEEAGLLALVLLGGIVVVRRSRRLEVDRRRERYYFLILISFFLAAKIALEIGRYYLLVAPLFFSFLVVFHYFSWYVFSLEKIDSVRNPEANGSAESWVDRILGLMATRASFLNAVFILNLISLAGVVAYHSIGSPGSLKYAFDLEYFLYFLVFHVTMSFAPRTLPAAARSPEIAPGNG